MTRRCSTVCVTCVGALVLGGLLAVGAKLDIVGASAGRGAGSAEAIVVPESPPRLPADPPAPGAVTVELALIDDVLTNPGMGFASFHFGWWCNLPPITYPPKKCAERVIKQWPENYPESGTAYFRWHWSDLESKRGEIDFDMIDAAIQSANALGMTLGFRVMTIAEGKSGIPDWLTNDVSGKWRDGDGGRTFWPDYRDATFQREHARLIAALGKRYDGHPAVDHIDIGTVGCWGEWNTACLKDAGDVVEVYRPSNGKERREIEKALTDLIDHHVEAFTKTPVIMLGLDEAHVGLLVHATRRGTGWRADCWGDWGMWSASWSHQGKAYPAMIKAATKADPGFTDVWKKAPVQLEICGTFEKWQNIGWTATKPNGEVYKSFQWALQHHASLLNAKSKPIPPSYTAAIDELLKRNGYRFVADRFTHPKKARSGSTFTFSSDWRNLGVAPAYLPRTLTYRLRSTSKTVTFESTEDVRTWLPGSWKTSDSITIPTDLPAGTYAIDVALLDRNGKAPDTKALPPLHLGIAGRRPDGWYPVSKLTVN